MLDRTVSAAEAQRFSDRATDPSSVGGAVLATLGEDLYALPALAQINVYLAVFAIEFLFAAYCSTPAHVDTMFYASAFEPVLPPNLDTQLGFQYAADMAVVIWRLPGMP